MCGVNYSIVARYYYITALMGLTILGSRWLRQSVRFGGISKGQAKRLGEALRRGESRHARIKER